MQAKTTKKVSASTQIQKTVKAETAKIASAIDAALKEKATNAGKVKIVLAANTHSKQLLVNTKTSKKALAKESYTAFKNTIPQKVTINNVTLKKVSFEQLPGWNKSGITNSLSAFQQSCKIFFKRKPSQQVGSRLIKIKAKDWLPACKEAVSIRRISEEGAKAFFEKWFYPLELVKRTGIFTGYYMPLVKGNLTRTKKYNTPIYGVPQKRNRRTYSRQQIDQGALNKKAPVLAWIHSPVERLFLEVEGSGVIKLASGKSLYLGYAGENGSHYTSVGSVLIRNGVMTRHTASKRAIRRYFKNNPTKVDRILQQNKSFVFFENVKRPVALGVQDITLTPGYSLAIDKKWIPLGSPLWLSTKKPLSQNNELTPFQRLMIAQDTGGAIRGLVRGDVYWGSGKNANFLGENMKNRGRYWLFLPKHIFDRLTNIGGMIG